jgi:hypothetical protein
VVLRSELPAKVLQAPAVPHVLTLMKTSEEYFTTTIYQVADITRLQQSQAAPIEEVNLPALLNEICLDLAPQLTASSGHLRVMVD